MYFADTSLLTRAGCRLKNVIYIGLREISSEEQPITDRQVFRAQLRTHKICFFACSSFKRVKT